MLIEEKNNLRQTRRLCRTGASSV